MSEDFETGLRDLYAQAAAAHADGSGFPTTVMADRARRNRRVRAMGVSVATVAAVAGIAIGGAAVMRWNDPAPVPPAETSVPGPTTDPAVGALTCGAMIADLAVLEDATIVIEATLDTATLADTDPLAATVVMAAVDPPGPTIMNEVIRGLQYVVVRDGVVVGIGRDDGDAPVVQLSGRDGIAREVTLVLAGCDSDGLTTVQLAPGEYELYAGLHAQIAGGPGGEGELLGGPWPFTIAEDAPSADPEAPQPSEVSAAFIEGEPLADGDYIALLRAVDAANGTVDVDLAMFYGGQAAEDYVAANVPGGEVTNDYYLANDVETTTTLPIAPDATVLEWCFGEDLTQFPRTVAEWAAAPTSWEGREYPPYECSEAANLLRGDLYWLQVRDGVVVAVVGQYVP